MATDDPIMASVAGRYASALFELASEQSLTSEVEQDLAAFQALIDESDDLKRLVRSPVFSADEQSKAMTAIVEKVGFRQLTANFLKLIARNRRLFALADVIRCYRDLAAKARGEVQADVASAAPLTEAQLAALSDTLKEAVGAQVRVNTRVDPELIGGLIVKVGSRMIDSSLATKLISLKTRMKEAH